jgi:hypothetical protein
MEKWVPFLLGMTIDFGSTGLKPVLLRGQGVGLVGVDAEVLDGVLDGGFADGTFLG